MPDTDIYGLLKWWNERMGTWTTDSEDNRVLRGLTKAETDELNEIQKNELATGGRDSVRWQSRLEAAAQASRRKVLLDTHNRARLDYAMANMTARRDRLDLDPIARLSP